MTEQEKTLQIEIHNTIDKLQNGSIHPLTAKTMLFDSAKKALTIPDVSKCACIEGRELLKAFLEHLESTIDYLPCEPSELIDDYYKSL